MKTISRTIVAAVLMSKDGKILIGKIRDGGVYPDCWHIPGGGVDEGETHAQALVREMKEEVGIDITDLPTKLLSDSETDQTEKTDKVTGEQMLVTMQFNTYQVDLPLDASLIQIHPNDDLHECRWVSIQDLDDYKLTPPSIKVFSKLGWV